MTQLNFYLGESTKDMDIDETGQIRFTQTRTEFLSQKVENVIQTFLGEWFLNREIGVPYWDEIFVKNPDVNNIKSLLILVVNDIPEVDKVVEMDVTFNRSTSSFQGTIQVLGLSETEPIEVNL